MSNPLKQHLIDPEICIRCYTCEEICSIGAISHNDDNVVVDASICEGCLDCISPCPTGSIDEWRVVQEPYSVEDQMGWFELPEQQEISGGVSDSGITDTIAALLAKANSGAGGNLVAPASAAKPSVNLFPPSKPLDAVVQGNFRLTADEADSDVRHIILNLGTHVFPVLEGQTVGITPPGADENGKPYQPRLFSVSSPRDGERANTNNLSLTVKREELGVCSNYLCDLEKGANVKLSGPFGSTFLMPDDPDARLIMICTGTGSAPFRGFTMRHQRAMAGLDGRLHLFFGARTPDALPYHGPLNKIPDAFLAKHFAFSRVGGVEKTYVQDRLREDVTTLAPMLSDPNTYIYMCGLKDMETGVDEALNTIAKSVGKDWSEIRNTMRESGRFHVETY